jgi:hypothetical protein
MPVMPVMVKNYLAIIPFANPASKGTGMRMREVDNRAQRIDLIGKFDIPTTGCLKLHLCFFQPLLQGGSRPPIVVGLARQEAGRARERNPAQVSVPQHLLRGRGDAQAGCGAGV